MLDSNVTNFLKTAMSREETLCQTLFELLADEQKCYETQNIDEISTILKEKSKLLDELEKSSEHRLAVFGIKSLLKNHQDIYEQQIANNTELLDQWKSLKTAMFRCKTQNEINGRIIDLSQKSLERTVNIFKQSLRPNNLTTYSSKGKAQQTQLHISSAKA
ncbi:flagella synthesis protein FlgN [Pleionea mediterranea]|jgi:flagellar biosynthesis/type III secretory pathway chaperone|uniref:Flagellar biosynthesis/type III secretory pathway chaperone n=1 Tax=Pleionea mediterranea TaxID=523701 RepID=A0A316FM01_9GAMM|nr:flagellar protein FlgN [Pleionea mediterranea]PWK49195.1 flagellar biosynthesis/type III secretory pathway chaperone [Pleionea mediterranea]